MRIDVTFRNFAPSVPLRGFAEDKLSRLARYLHKPLDAHVTLSTEGFRHLAEATVRADGEVFTGSESSDEDMYAAIDLLVDKLARQARRHRGRARAHQSRAVKEVVGRLEADRSREQHADLDAELDALGE